MHSDPTTTFVQTFFHAHGILPIAGAESADTSQGGGGSATAAPPSGGSGDAGDQQQGGEGQQSNGNQGGEADRNAALDGRMDDLIRQVSDISSRIPAGETPPSPAEQSTQSLLDQLFPEPEENDANAGNGQQLNADDPNAIRDAISPLLRQELRGALEPVIRQQEEDRVQREQERIRSETSALFEEYPTLANDREYLAQTIGEADEWARLANIPAERAREPRFVELVHLAQIGARAAGDETPAGQGEGQVGLEGARGSQRTSAAPTAEDSRERMKNAGPESSFFT